MSIRKLISNIWARRICDFKMVIEDKELLQISVSLLTSLLFPLEVWKIQLRMERWSHLNIPEHFWTLWSIPAYLIQSIGNCKKSRQPGHPRHTKVNPKWECDVWLLLFLTSFWDESDLSFGFLGNSAENSQYIMDNL